MRASDTDHAPLQGNDASVFGTNATSNKPADLWELLSDGEIGNLYEVTCKTVDEDRLNAAIDSFIKLGIPTKPITFICRIPTDCSTLPIDNGAMTFRGVPFQFLDFTDFIEMAFVLLTPAKRQLVMDELSAFVSDPGRAVTTKKAWADAFG